MIFWLFIGLYVLTMLLKVVIDYDNVRTINKHDITIAILRARIRNLDLYVSLQEERMRRAYSEKKGKLDVAKRSRLQMKFNRSAKTLTVCLGKTLVAHLHKTKRLNGGGISVSLLMPDPTGIFKTNDNSYNTNGKLHPPTSDTGINCNDKETVAGYLWKNKEVTSLSFSSAKIASQIKRFKIMHLGQLNSIKSIFCVQLIDPATEETFAIWSIDSDVENVFPNSDSSDEKEVNAMREIQKIVDSFILRLVLVNAYDKILKKIEPLFAEDKD
ncbi:MAG: hypothetical protein GQ535_05455 [Rhodobacteraceae bacterium]|nr:hypothetical protein [Paracoccaceae bacterium]